MMKAQRKNLFRNKMTISRSQMVNYTVQEEMIDSLDIDMILWFNFAKL